jgi:hypothetical protein
MRNSNLLDMLFLPDFLVGIRTIDIVIFLEKFSYFRIYYL